MKQLPQHTGNPVWDNDLLDDLSYIKAKLRYRMKLRTAMPVIVWSTMMLIIAAIILTILYTGEDPKGEEISAKRIVGMFLPSMFIVGIIIRYIQSLKFISLPTPYYLQDDSELVERFLTSQHMLIFRHPEAPEVYQILSRNISAGKEDREVLIFIADDKRILINSHFTNQGWGFSPRGHHHQMANMLKQFIQAQEQAGTTLTHQSF